MNCGQGQREITKVINGQEQKRTEICLAETCPGSVSSNLPSVFLALKNCRQMHLGYLDQLSVFLRHQPRHTENQKTDLRQPL